MIRERFTVLIRTMTADREVPLCHGAGIRLLSAVALAGAALFASTAAASAAPSMPQAVGGGSDYTSVDHMFSDSCLDVAGAKTANYTNVQQYTCDANSLSTDAQTWFFVPEAVVNHNVEYMIKFANSCPGGTLAFSCAPDFSGSCLDVFHGNNTDHTNVDIYSCLPSDNSQLWIADSKGELVSAVSGSTPMCLDVLGGSVADGANVEIFRCDGADSQKWDFQFPHAPYPDDSMTRNQNSSSCLDVAGAKTANYTNVQQYACGANSLSPAAQTWFVVPMSVVGHNIEYMFKFANSCPGGAASNCSTDYSGSCLDVFHGHNTDHTNVDIYSCLPNDNSQLWIADPSGELISAVSGTTAMCLDVLGASTANGANVEIFHCHTGSSQLWDY